VAILLRRESDKGPGRASKAGSDTSCVNEAGREPEEYLFAAMDRQVKRVKSRIEDSMWIEYAWTYVLGRERETRVRDADAEGCRQG
jgi:hypothetical protein